MSLACQKGSAASMLMGYTGVGRGTENKMAATMSLGLMSDYAKHDAGHVLLSLAAWGD